MSYLEELLPEFRKGAKIRRKDWDKGKYIVCNGAFVDNDLGRVHSLTNSDITGNVWEFYQEPEPDWDYIIKNKCLCWFWDDNFKEACVGILGGVYEGLRSKYTLRDEDGNQIQCRNCRPVRRDEVTFYEDREG